MARKSGWSGRDGGYCFEAPQVTTETATGRFPAQDGVSISLRFYTSNVECFSDWARQDLREFTALLAKLREVDPFQLKANHSMCKAHCGPAKTSGYNRPTGISKEIKLYELRAAGGLRIHGVFQGPVFHLVWLDRNHAYFG